MEEPVPSITDRPSGEADARAARALATLDAYRQWNGNDLPGHVAALLRDLDRQQLMTTAAVCLARVASGDSA